MSDDLEFKRPEEGIIRFGNYVSLKHNMTGRYLTSTENKLYAEGDNSSEQQVVYGGDWEPTPDSTFVVVNADPENYEEIVRFGSKIKLTHLPTGFNLHTHPGFLSPVTEQQEATCYGGDTDENDEWVVEQWTFDEEENENFGPEDTTWYVGRSFFLRHVPTERTLHSHEEYFPEEEIYEVTGFGDGPDENDRWRIAF